MNGNNDICIFLIGVKAKILSFELRKAMGYKLICIIV